MRVLKCATEFVFKVCFVLKEDSGITFDVFVVFGFKLKASEPTLSYAKPIKLCT